MNKKTIYGLIVGLIVIAGLSISVAGHGMNSIGSNNQDFNYMQGMNGIGMQQMMNTMRGNQYNNNGYLLSSGRVQSKMMYPMNSGFYNMPCHR